MIRSVALTALLVAGAGDPAASANPSGVTLQIESCPALPAAELAQLVALELGTPALPPGQVGDRVARVQVTCDGAIVRIAVADPPTGTALARATVFPPERQNVLVRLVAIAISELVLTSRGEVSLEKQRAAAALPAAPPSPHPPGAPAPPGSAIVLAVGQAVGPFAGVGVGWGGGVRIGWVFGGSWGAHERAGRVRPALDLELGGARAAADRPLGTVAASLWSATLRGSLQLRAGGAWAEASAGGRFGLAQIQGQPRDPASARCSAVTGTWTGPLAYLGVGVGFGHVVLAAGVEAGRVLRSVAGLVDQGAPVAISGNWVCGTLAAGWGG